jgi:hypothetical protein
MLERDEADIIYFVPGEAHRPGQGERQNDACARALGLLVAGFPDLQNPKNPFRDKRVRRLSVSPSTGTP